MNGFDFYRAADHAFDLVLAASGYAAVLAVFVLAAQWLAGRFLAPRYMQLGVCAFDENSIRLDCSLEEVRLDESPSPYRSVASSPAGAGVKISFPDVQTRKVHVAAALRENQWLLVAVLPSHLGGPDEEKLLILLKAQLMKDDQAKGGG